MVSPYLLSGRRMAFLAQHPAVVDFLDLMSIVPDLRLEQILVRAGSVLDGTTVAAASAAYRDATILAIRRASGEPISYPGPEIGLAVGDRVVVLGSLPTLDAMGASACLAISPMSTVWTDGQLTRDRRCLTSDRS